MAKSDFVDNFLKQFQEVGTDYGLFRLSTIMLFYCLTLDLYLGIFQRTFAWQSYILILLPIICMMYSWRRQLPHQLILCLFQAR